MARMGTKGSWTRDDVKQLKKLFPDWPYTGLYDKDWGSVDLGWVVAICRDKENVSEL